MKYSILGFNQEKLIHLQKKVIDLKTEKEKVIRVDVVDLLILRDVADFMNRKKVIKYVIDEKTYFNVKYDTIIKDLPILDIKQQALRDRLNKLCMFNLLEKEVIKNQAGSFVAFRIGNEYENIVYDNGYIGTDSKIPVQVYSDTSASVAEYQCNIHNNIYNNTTNNSTTNNNNKEKEKEKEKESAFEIFNNFVKLYKKLTKKPVRGVKTEFDEFKKRHKDWEKVLPYLAIAIERETKAREDAKNMGQFFPEPKMLQTYLGKQRAWELYVSIDEDINELNNEYNPIQSPMLSWNDYYKCYMYTGYWDGHISDGYDDDNRPNGVEITLNNGRGIIVWNKEQKKWIKK